MSMQMRMSQGDARLYSVDRDVAHNFSAVMTTVMNRLSAEDWPELNEVLRREKVTLDDLDQACNCFVLYMVASVDKSLKDLSMIDHIRNSGFLECKPAAQVAVMAMFGISYAGIQFLGLREATVPGEEPLMNVAELVKQSEKLYRYMRMSRWQRHLVAWFQRMRLKYLS